MKRNRKCRTTTCRSKQFFDFYKQELIIITRSNFITQSDFAKIIFGELNVNPDDLFNFDKKPSREKIRSQRLWFLDVHRVLGRYLGKDFVTPELLYHFLDAWNKGKNRFGENNVWIGMNAIHRTFRTKEAKMSFIANSLNELASIECFDEFGDNREHSLIYGGTKGVWNNRIIFSFSDAFIEEVLEIGRS